MNTVIQVIYLVSMILFIFSLKRLSRVKTARSGNVMASLAMALAVVGTLMEIGGASFLWIGLSVALGALLGALLALKVQMTSMPEMVALLNGLGGAASALVALSVFWSELIENGATQTAALSLGPVSSGSIVISIFVGSLTLTGSLIAFLKLKGSLRSGKPILLPVRHWLSALVLVGAGVGSAYALGSHPEQAQWCLLLVTGAAALLGVLLAIPVGGADMPVMVSLLNSYSGVAAATAGFVVGSPLLIIAGALVGAAGLILTQIMCKAMNRSLLNVLLGGFGQLESKSEEQAVGYEQIKSSSAEEAAMLLESAENVIVVPGYGLAVAQAQHAVRELTDILCAAGARVRFAIHPVAGRMPGHMNVLLAEADVDYELLYEMESINAEFKNTDVVIVVGANDVVNPAAANDPTSPIFGMPVLNAHEARSVFVVKRSLSAGYAGVKNPLFEAPNTMMLFDDAKSMLQSINAELNELLPSKNAA